MHFYYERSIKLNGSGFVHLLFSTIVMFFSLFWLFSTNFNTTFLISGMFLVVFGSSMYYGSYKINNGFNLIDFIYVTAIVLVVVIKLGFYFL